MVHLVPVLFPLHIDEVDDDDPADSTQFHLIGHFLPPLPNCCGESFPLDRVCQRSGPCSRRSPSWLPCDSITRYPPDFSHTFRLSASPFPARHPGDRRGSRPCRKNGCARSAREKTAGRNRGQRRTPGVNRSTGARPFCRINHGPPGSSGSNPYAKAPAPPVDRAWS